MNKELAGSNTRDEDVWKDGLTEGIREYESRRDELFDLVNNKNIQGESSLSLDDLNKFAKIAIEVEENGDWKTLVGSRGTGALMVAKEILDWGKQNLLDEAA